MHGFRWIVWFSPFLQPERSNCLVRWAGAHFWDNDPGPNMAVTVT